MQAFAFALLGIALFLPQSAACAFTAIPLDPLTAMDPTLAEPAGPAGAKIGDGWRKSNPAWDGTRARISGALGERGAIQIILLPDPGETLKDIRLFADVPGLRIRGAWRAWRIWNAFETAVPLPPAGPRFDIPSSVPLERESERRDGQTAWSVWLEYEIPENAAPGAHAGTLHLRASGESADIPVLARVFPFAMPAAPSFIVEMNSYGDYARLLGKSPEAFLKLQRLFHDFRCSFTLVPYRQSGGMALDFLAPTIRSGEDGGKLLDWREFDAALSGLFDGSAFADGVPVSHFLLPFSFDWPAPGALLADSPEEYRRRNVLARREFADHIREKGWTGVMFQEFHNENPEHGSASPWFLDEPRSPMDIDGHVLFQGFLADSRTPGTSRPLILYRVDISDRRALGKDFSRLASGVEVWSVSEDPKYLNAPSAAAYAEYARKNDGFAMAYGELPGFLADGRPANPAKTALRILRTRALGLDGYAQWITDLWKEKPTGSGGLPAAAGPLFYANASGARDLVWPGEWLGVEGPLPSLRLFAVREAQNLLDYAALARERGLLDETSLCEELGGLKASAGAFYALKDRLAATMETAS